MPFEWFTKCCGCVPLRTGTFVLGYLLTLTNIVQLFFTTINVTSLNMIIEKYHINDGKITLMKYTLYAVAFIFACQMVMSINLLVGLHKKQRVHVEKFYKVYPVLMFIFYILFFIVFCINAKHYTEKEWLLHIADVVILFLQIYTVFIVVQCAKEMMQQELLHNTRSGASAAAGVKFTTNTKNSNAVV